MIETINPPLLTDHQSGTSSSVLEEDADTIIDFKTVRFLHNGATEADTIIGQMGQIELSLCQVYSEHSFRNQRPSQITSESFFKERPASAAGGEASATE
jgi:hypothetical protein